MPDLLGTPAKGGGFSMQKLKPYCAWCGHCICCMCIIWNRVELVELITRERMLDA